MLQFIILVAVIAVIFKVAPTFSAIVGGAICAAGTVFVIWMGTYFFGIDLHITTESGGFTPWSVITFILAFIFYGAGLAGTLKGK